MRNHAGLLAAFLLLAFAASEPVEGKDLPKRKWIEVSTQNFTLHSTLNEKRSVEFLRYLELMRLTVPYITNIESTASTVSSRSSFTTA